MTDEQFRRFATGLSHVVWRLSSDGKRIVAPRWAEITGKKEHELQNGGWLETIHADDRPKVHEALRGAVVYGSRFQAEYRLHLRDGSYQWCLGRGEPTRGDRGEIIGWIGVSSNIDDQKRAETALLEKEVHLRMVIDAARVGTIDHDVVTGKVQASSVALTLLGLPSGTELTFDMVQRCVHPDDRAAFALATLRATAQDGNGEIDVVFRSLHADGRITWVSARGCYEFQGSGADRRAVRFIGVASDLTMHMRDLAERAMLSAIVSSSNDAIIAITLAGAISHWNASAERIFGYRADQMMGESILRLIPPEDVEQFRASLGAISRGESVPGRTTRRITASGQPIDVSLTLSLIRDELGRPAGISAIMRDITHEKRLEAEVAQSQKMEAVGNLAGGVAHDLNNILTALLAGVEFAGQSQNIDPETRRDLAEVRNDCFRAAGLVRQLLAVAKRQVINPRPCDVNAAIKDLAPLLAKMIGEDVKLSILPRATCGVFVDAGQLDQVMFNLASNGRDAMRGVGTLTIEMRDDTASNTVVISVTDTGTGMTPEVKAHLFEPFFTTKDVGQGTGLGLSTAYGIVAQSGGTMSVDSEPGLGTTINISLPAIESPVTANTKPRLAEGPRGDETILIVEDDRSVRDQIVRYFGQLGYTVIEARNGAEAIVAMEHHGAPVHLVVTDVVMPEMSGVDLVTHLRDWYPRLRVLFMSGYSARAVETYGVVVDDTELLQKPFELSQLAVVVRRILDQTRRTPADTTAFAVTA